MFSVPERRKMSFIAKIIVISVVCGAIQAQDTQNLTFIWKKEILGLGTYESALIYRGRKGQEMMLMKADDEHLRDTPFPQSTSLHDFQPNRFLESSQGIGTLAIKVRNTCFIGDIPRSYDEILREAKRRSESGTAIPYTLSQSRYVINQRSKIGFEDLLDYSYELTEFCSDADQLFTLIPVAPALYPFWPPWWPWWPICFWGPIIIAPDINVGPIW